MEPNLETLPIGEDAPQLVNAVIEVPVGSRNKYEYEPNLGVIMRDRLLPGAVRYPTDYGFVPSTLTDRGDALDIVVAAYDPAFPGCVVRARPIGALHIADSKGEEHNVLAVPDSEIGFVLVLLLTVMAAALILASGVALALSKIGTNGPDTLRGTNGNDDLLGRGGQDDLFALDGRDNLIGGAGRDNVWAAHAAPEEAIRTWWAAPATTWSWRGAAPTASWAVPATTMLTAIPAPTT